MNALEYLKTRGCRMPNELLFFLRGEKEPVVSYLLHTLPEQITVLAPDDNLDQLKSYEKNPRIIPVQAVRTTSKQYAESGKVYQTIQMDQENFNDRLLEIIQSLSQQK